MLTELADAAHRRDEVTFVGRIRPDVGSVKEHEPTRLGRFDRDANGIAPQHHDLSDIEGNAPGDALAVVSMGEPLLKLLGERAALESGEAIVAPQPHRREQR